MEQVYSPPTQYSIVNPLHTRPKRRKSQRRINLKKKMFGTAVRFLARKSKPKMEPIAMKTPPEQRNTIATVLFDIVKEHGPITVSNTWNRVKEVGLKDLTSKNHMKIMLKWMRERKKLRLLCNHVGAHKQFLYTTSLTDPAPVPAAATPKRTPSTRSSKRKPSPRIKNTV